MIMSVKSFRGFWYVNFSDGAPRKLVVCTAGGARGYLELPESRISEECPFITGGERFLYERAR
jgi:hypothetical protein